MSRRAFTLVEVLVVTAVMAILASMLFPVLASARGAARQASCVSNQRQLGMALAMYVMDYDDRYCQSGYYAELGSLHYSWCDLIWPYARSTQVFDCPAGRTKWQRNHRYPTTYTLNDVYADSEQLGGIFGGFEANLVVPPLATADVLAPVKTVFCGDGELYHAANLRVDDPVQLTTEPPQFKCSQGAFLGRHHNGCVVSLLDGHAKWMPIPELGRKRAGIYVHFAITEDQ